MLSQQSQELIFSNSVAQAIEKWVNTARPSKLFVIADSNTAELCLPVIERESKVIADAHRIVFPAGETHKNLDTLASIWGELCDYGASRSAAVVNLGGGVVTDMGGFAAATFKRGIRFVNVPTTLLAAVDAAVGGKTGIDFHGFKNEIGAFCCADAVIISTLFFNTLPQSERMSGFAEMLKHSLIAGGDAFSRLTSVKEMDFAGAGFLELLKESVLVKKRIVEQDPTEKGLRKALNLGHTAGHAFESWALEQGKPVPHGYAVAWGLVVDLVLSHIQLGFPSETLRAVSAFIEENYGRIAIDCSDYDTLVEIMRHDKKNAGDGSISFTLLRAPGEVDVNRTATPEEISVALDIFRDLLHI
ncbi:MAG: 3-dehydroquinate synthase [Paramuribaculum sp.]|nr:3-dehydroquinate synthase [Paramuribaculum sp.]